MPGSTRLPANTSAKCPVGSTSLGRSTSAAASADQPIRRGEGTCTGATCE